MNNPKGFLTLTLKGICEAVSFRIPSDKSTAAPAGRVSQAHKDAPSDIVPLWYNRFAYGQSPGLLILINIILVGCNFSQNSISIESITEKKLGKTVQITGKVTELAPLIRSAGYRLQDDTGSVWIITSNSLPILETEITIEGRVQIQDIMIENKNLSQLYLVELQKLSQVSE